MKRDKKKFGAIQFTDLPFYSIQLFVTYDCRGIDLSNWQELQSERGEVADMEKFVQHVHQNHFIPNTVLVDCTANPDVASNYYNWLRRGIHVITPNKRANSGPLDQVPPIWNGN